ncbi:MAG: hypothetical protein LBN00_09955 [Oscillospiraceae bacterium]|jgi:hypothetical protein|nr:hypothetical protein [Oscillospiraceae bacterium]
MPGISTPLITGGKSEGILFGRYDAAIRSIVDQKLGAEDNEENIFKLFKRIKGKGDAEVAFGSVSSLDDFEPTAPLEDANADEFSAGFAKKIEFLKYTKKLVIASEDVEFEHTHIITSKARQFANAYITTRKKQLGLLYGSALQGQSTVNVGTTAMDLTTADGQPLFSAAHPSKLDPAFVQSNVGSDDLTMDTIDYVEAAGQNFEGDRHNLLGMNFDTIVIGNDGGMKRKAFAAVGSPGSFAADNRDAFNWQYGRWNVIIDPYLYRYTGATKPWFLVDSTYLQEADAAVLVDWKPLTLTNKRDEDKDAYVYFGRGMYRAGFVDWRYAIAGGVPGAAAFTPAGLIPVSIPVTVTNAADFPTA